MKPVDRIKQVRILHQSARGSKDIFAQLHEQQDSYLQHLETITKFSKTSKKKTQDNLYKLEWVDEHKRLEQLAHKLEQGVNQLVQMLLMQDAQNSYWYNYLQEQENSVTERSSLKSQFKKQLQEIKSLHQEYALQNNVGQSGTNGKGKRPSRHANPININMMRSQSSDSARKTSSIAAAAESSNDASGNIAANNQIISSFMAQFYLHVHEEQQLQYNELMNEETKISQELKNLSKYYNTMILEDELQQQSLEYEEEMSDLIGHIQKKVEDIDSLHSRYTPSGTILFEHTSSKASPVAIKPSFEPLRAATSPPSSSNHTANAIPLLTIPGEEHPRDDHGTSSDTKKTRWTLPNLFSYLLSHDEGQYTQLSSFFSQVQRLDSEYYANMTTTTIGGMVVSTPRSTTTTGTTFDKSKWSKRHQDCFHKWKTKANFTGMARHKFLEIVDRELHALSTTKPSLHDTLALTKTKVDTIQEMDQEDSEEGLDETASGHNRSPHNPSSLTPRSTKLTTKLFMIDDILEYELYYEQKKKSSQQFQQQETQYFASREELFTKITNFMNELLTQLTTEYNELQEYYQFQAHKQAISTRLSSLQQKYAEQKQKEKAMAAERLAQLQEEEQRTKDVEEQRRQQMKQLLSDYHTMQSQRQAQLKQQEELEAEMLAKEKAELSKKNAPKIEYRQQLYEAKIRQLKDKEVRYFLVLNLIHDDAFGFIGRDDVRGRKEIGSIATIGGTSTILSNHSRYCTSL